MRNRNKTMRTVLRWVHLVVGWLIGVFVYTPAREDETFVLLMQVVFVPVVVLTGVWIWQQARIRRLYGRLRRKSRRGTANGPEQQEVYADADIPWPLIKPVRWVNAVRLRGK